MATTNFKLTKDSIIRRASLPYRPTWDVLAGRIEYLFDIPIQSIAVSYVDSDGDVVTLSSNEELQDYYVSSLNPNTQLVKFSVVDLGSLRDTASPASTARPIPNPGTHRPNTGSEGTFGLGEEFFDIGAEWQNYPDPRTFSAIFNGAVPAHNTQERTPSEFSHGFIETVHSDTSSVSKAFDSEPESDNDSDIVDLSEPQVDKGKGRADAPGPLRPTVEEVPDEEASSTKSMLCEDAPEKPPVHVYEHEKTISQPPSERAPSVVATPTPMSPASLSHHSTPRFSLHSVDKPASEASFHEKSVSEVAAAQDEDAAADPPLADDPPAPNASSNTNPTFSNDIAAYITNLVNAFSSHPELSEGLRNLLDNARNGTYWAAHREALSRAASVAQGEAYAASADMRRAAEEEAGRRVTEALGAVVRSLTSLTGVSAGVGAVGQATQTSDAGRDADERSDRLGDDATVRNSLWGEFPRSGRRSSARRASWGLPHYGPTQFDWTRPFSYWGNGAETPASFNPFDPVTAVPGRPPMRTVSERMSTSSRPNSQHGFPGFGRGPAPPPPFDQLFGWPSARPPPPPPPGAHPPHPPPPGPPHGRGAPPPPPPPPPFPPHHRGHHGPPPPPPPPPGPPHHMPPPPPSGNPQHPPHPRHPDQFPGHPEGYYMPPLTAHPSPQELKERVEIAKQVYQMEKARFRKDREERKRDKRLNEEAQQPAKPVPAPRAAPIPSTAPEAPAAPIVPTRAAPVTSTPPHKTSHSIKTSGSPQIASAARGSFPPLEVVSVSKESTPKPSPHHQRTVSQTQRPLLKKALTPPQQPTAGPSGINRDAGLNGRQRSLHRITKKLADMGFTPTSYSSLPAKIESQVGPTAPATKDEEDNVVTSVLEELLNMSPQSSSMPEPSRAERRQSKMDDSSSIPGGWDH